MPDPTGRGKAGQKGGKCFLMIRLCYYQEIRCNIKKGFIIVLTSSEGSTLDSGI